MNFRSAVVVLALLAGLGWPAGAFFVGQDSSIHFGGRTWTADKGAVGFDWPGIYWQTGFTGTSCALVLAGEAIYDVLVDGDTVAVLQTGVEAGRYLVAQGLPEGKHSLRVQKRTESQRAEQLLLGIELDAKAQLLAPRAGSGRRIEFIGDSYTVGYGALATGRDPLPGQDEDSLLLATTNASISFAVLIARSVAADYQINAFSGKGLVRNLNGMDPGKEYPWFLDAASASQRQTRGTLVKWHAERWHPQVIVIGLGINDWQGSGPYPDSTVWDKAYGKLLQDLRTKHPGVKFVLCATGVWPTEALIPRVKAVVAAEQAAGHKDVTYFEYGAERTGLHWHPSKADHAEIARQLRPVVSRLGGWLSR